VNKGIYLEFEKIDETFASYGLWQAPLAYQGKSTPFKAILKEIGGKREVIAILGRGYRLVPNGMVDEAVQQVAKVLRIDYAGVGSPRDIRQGEVVRTEDPDSFRAYWTMVFPQKYSVDGGVYLGVQVRNSEDGSMGFGIDLFTFREICSNGAILRTGDLEIRTYWKHTKGLQLDVGKIKNVIVSIVDKGQRVLETYRKLQELKLNEEIAERLSKRISKKYLPEYLQAVKDEIKILKPASLWEVYNDITELVWHSDTASMFSMRRFNQELNKALGITVR